MKRGFYASVAIALTACFVGAVRAQDNAYSGAAAAEGPFLAENVAAMNKMMADMNAKPTGDVDADFVAMMIPHHQGAVDMALAVLRYGKNEQIRRIAQEIIVDQEQEIAAMRLALGQPLPPSTPAPTQPGLFPAVPGPAGPAHDRSASPQKMTMSPAAPAQQDLRQ
jgi:hypothetical protein